MIIYLIRHTSVAVEPGICYGQSDVSLKSSFQEEAAITSSLLKDIKFDKVYTSPLSRCLKLATYCGYPDAERDNRLMEINFGDWEMQPFASITDKKIEEWYKDYLNVRATNGESFMDQYARVANFMNDLKKNEYDTVAIFAHGGTIINARIYSGDIKIEDSFNSLTPYGGIEKIELK